jgi:hypothetical protein
MRALHSARLSMVHEQPDAGECGARNREVTRLEREQTAVTAFARYDR